MALSVLVAPANAHFGVDVDVETCEELNFESDLKYSYMAGEPIYVRGKTQNFLATLDIYLIYDDETAWGDVARSIPERVPGTLQTVVTNATGFFGPAILWDTAQPGKYDIIIDVNNNGVFNPEKDAVWTDQIEVTAGFFVLPEYPLGALIAIVSCFAAFLIIKRSSLTALKR